MPFGAAARLKLARELRRAHAGFEVRLQARHVDAVGAHEHPLHQPHMEGADDVLVNARDIAEGAVVDPQLRGPGRRPSRPVPRRAPRPARRSRVVRRGRPPWWPDRAPVGDRASSSTRSSARPGRRCRVRPDGNESYWGASRSPRSARRCPSGRGCRVGREGRGHADHWPPRGTRSSPAPRSSSSLGHHSRVPNKSTVYDLRVLCDAGRTRGVRSEYVAGW